MAAPAIDKLCERSASFLEAVYSREQALFPFSTSVGRTGYVNDFRRPAAIRYTINTLLGLQEAARRGGTGTDPEHVDSLVDAFLERQYGNIASCADLGLLLVLLRGRRGRPEKRDALQRIEAAARKGSAARLDMQALAWMVWGTTASAAAGGGGAEAADRLFRLVADEFVHPASLLPRHSGRLYRRGLVSFGAVVYFLRALHEYAALTGHPRARELFLNGVDRMIGIQGPNGEWPWLFEVRSGRPVEAYPVFAVHQDSMAMLWLLPAYEAGMPTARRAIEQSVAWVLGRNELGVPMIAEGPFRAYRSIERKEAFPRPARFLRALGNSVLGRSSSPGAGRLRINPECRSYHLGWILYVWSGREALLADVARRNGAGPSSLTVPSAA